MNLRRPPEHVCVFSRYCSQLTRPCTYRHCALQKDSLMEVMCGWLAPFRYERISSVWRVLLSSHGWKPLSSAVSLEPRKDFTYSQWRISDVECCSLTNIPANLMFFFFYHLSVSLFSSSSPPSESQFGVLHWCSCPLHYAERLYVWQRVWGRGARPETGCFPQTAVPKCTRLLLCKSYQQTRTNTRHAGTGPKLHQLRPSG